MKKSHLLVYSSVTGNTRAVAEAIYEIMPEESGIYPVHKAPDPNEYDLVVLGFWVSKAAPDPRMLRYMATARGKRVAWFGTLAAWPDSPHANLVRKNAAEALEGNEVLGGFLCQGRLSEKRMTQMMSPDYQNTKHPVTPERRARLLEAEKHPNADDFKAAQDFFKKIIAEIL